MSNVIAQGLQSFATTQTRAFEDPYVRGTQAATLILAMITLVLVCALFIVLKICEKKKKKKKNKKCETYNLGWATAAFVVLTLLSYGVSRLVLMFRAPKAAAQRLALSAL